MQSVSKYFPFKPMYTIDSSLYPNDPVSYIINDLKRKYILVHGLNSDVTLIKIGVLGGLKINIPFIIVSGKYKNSISRYLSDHVGFITIRSIVFMNRWGYALSARDDGSISHSNKHKQYNEWEGWVIEFIDEKNVFISRNNFNGNIVLAIDDFGQVHTTPSRVREGWEEFEMVIQNNYYEEFVTFQRVKKPRYFLSCSPEGIIGTNQDINSSESAWFIN